MSTGQLGRNQNQSHGQSHSPGYGPGRSQDRHHADDQQSTGEDFTRLISDITQSCETYCRHRPGVVAGLLFGLGFFCGWKLRPW